MMRTSRARSREATLAATVAAFVVGLACAMSIPARGEPTRYPAAGTVELAFTPGDAVDATILGAIAAAEHEVLVLAYSFTHPKISRALGAARLRGVRVEVIADRGQTLELPQSVVPALARDGIPVWLDGNFAAAHNKVVVIDADGAHAATITGSYNFTIAAQKRNAENIVVFRDNPDVARAYRAYFRRLQTRAQRWSGDGAPPGRGARSAR